MTVGLDFGGVQKSKGKTHKTITLPLTFYRHVTWFLTSREEHKWKVFENRVLRIMSGPKWDQVTGKWRKLHNGDFHNLYSSPNIIRRKYGGCYLWHACVMTAKCKRFKW
jgi:hypothetical protein